MAIKLTLLILSLIISFSNLAQAPIADFSASPLVACVGEAILFTNTSSSNGGSEIQELVWDFGDGNSSSEESLSHAYSLPGTYTVSLVVTNANGDADPEVKDSYLTILPTPNADFSPLGLGCTIPLTLSFQINSSTEPNYNYAWDFGNGEDSTFYDPNFMTLLEYEYPDSGSYTAVITITDTIHNCPSIDSVDIRIHPNPTAEITADPECFGDSTSF